MFLNHETLHCPPDFIYSFIFFVDDGEEEMSETEARKVKKKKKAKKSKGSKRRQRREVRK